MAHETKLTRWHTLEREEVAKTPIFVLERAKRRHPHDGREGSFFAQHNGVMDRGKPSLDLAVVPDSGTGELTGLRGRIAIDITGGKHFYTFDYELDEG